MSNQKEFELSPEKPSRATSFHNPYLQVLYDHLFEPSGDKLAKALQELLDLPEHQNAISSKTLDETLCRYFEECAPRPLTPQELLAAELRDLLGKYAQHYGVGAYMPVKEVHAVLADYHRRTSKEPTPASPRPDTPQELDAPRTPEPLSSHGRELVRTLLALIANKNEISSDSLGDIWADYWLLFLPTPESQCGRWLLLLDKLRNLLSREASYIPTKEVESILAPYIQESAPVQPSPDPDDALNPAPLIPLTPLQQSARDEALKKTPDIIEAIQASIDRYPEELTVDKRVLNRVLHHYKSLGALEMVSNMNARVFKERETPAEPEHGREAQELRKGLQGLILECIGKRPVVPIKMLMRLLNNVDARDSRAFLESHPEEEETEDEQ